MEKITRLIFLPKTYLKNSDDKILEFIYTIHANTNKRT